MNLSFRNNNFEHIVANARHINYANGRMLFGFYNQYQLSTTLELNISDISLQADLVARELYSNRSKIDFKRFCGSDDKRWQAILHTAYVYDRLKSIYYGVNSRFMLDLPSDQVSFTGHVLLTRLLSKASFTQNTNDSQPYSVTSNIICETNLDILFKEAFEQYPSLKYGMSDIPGFYSYVNVQYEAVLRGLYNSLNFINSSKGSFKSKRNGNGKNEQGDNPIQSSDVVSKYSMTTLDDPKIDQFTMNESNPLMNSFLGDNGTKFYFIQPLSESRPESMRFNESLFFSRASGFVSKQVNIDGNPLYTCVNRGDQNLNLDPLVREDVYAITGLKTELVPYSTAQIREYLEGANDLSDFGGTFSDNP